MKRTIWIVILLISNISATYSQFLFQFNSEDEFKDNFIEAGFIEGIQYKYSSSLGVEGVPGRIELGFQNDTLFYNQPMTLRVGEPIATAVQFGYRSRDFGGRTNTIAQMGFVDELIGHGLWVGGTNAQVAVGLYGGPVTDRQLIARAKAQGLDQRSLSPVFDVGNGVYELYSEWELLDIERIRFNARLLAVDDRGLAGPDPIMSYSGVLTNAVIANDPTLFLGFEFTWSMGFDYLDNIRIVPEPSTWLILVIGFTLLSAARMLQSHRGKQI